MKKIGKNTKRRWSVETNVSVPRFFVQEKQLSRLTKKILVLAEKLCAKKMVPAKNIKVLSVMICSDAVIHKLNSDYRGKDKPTDVLSFSHIEGIKNVAPNAPLGDLVISAQTLKRQAKEYEVTNLEELHRLLVHGVLHLFGYDHENVSRKAKKEMERLEDEIRNIL